MEEETEIPLAHKIKSLLSKVKLIFKKLVIYIHTELRRYPESSAWF